MREVMCFTAIHSHTPPPLLLTHTPLPHALTQEEFERKRIVKVKESLPRGQNRPSSEPVTYSEPEINCALIILQLLDARISELNQLKAHNKNLRLRCYHGKSRCHMLCYIEYVVHQ